MSGGWDYLAGILKVRPLTEALPEPTYAGWAPSPFSADWSTTVVLLDHEVEQLKAREVILEADFREGHLRKDGLPRADARPPAPGVILTLIGTPHGDLRYPCSTFRDWQSNVRAIALALEALRKVDRYGVTKSGQQYAGWRALESGDAAQERYGLQIIERHGSVRAALRATHPDSREEGYTDASFAAVQAARHLHEGDTQ